MLSCILNNKPKLPTMIMKIFKLHILILENVKDNYVKKFGDFSSKDFKQCYIPCVCLLYINAYAYYIQYISIKYSLFR